MSYRTRVLPPLRILLRPRAKRRPPPQETHSCIPYARSSKTLLSPPPVQSKNPSTSHPSPCSPCFLMSIPYSANAVTVSLLTPAIELAFPVDPCGYRLRSLQVIAAPLLGSHPSGASDLAYLLLPANFSVPTSCFLLVLSWLAVFNSGSACFGVVHPTYPPSPMLPKPGLPACLSAFSYLARQCRFSSSYGLSPRSVNRPDWLYLILIRAFAVSSSGAGCVLRRSFEPATAWLSARACTVPSTVLVFAGIL